MPGWRVNVPVGSAGVPAQVQVLVALAVAVPRPAIAREATARAMTARNVRLFICGFLSGLRRDHSNCYISAMAKAMHHVVQMSRDTKINRGMRMALIDAAARLIATEGLGGLTLRRVTEEVGTSTMAVYTHFGGMPELRQS